MKTAARSLFYLAVCLGCLASFVPAELFGGQARAVSGRDRAVIEPPPGAVVEPYRNAGYSLVRRGDSVVVEVDTRPLASSAVLTPPPLSPSADGVSRLARSLVGGTSLQYRAVSRVLAWVSRNIRYELDRSAPQDAGAVLARRSGYCTGIAGLAVALLREVGVEAREVSGYVVDERGQGGYHRWIEVHYPDVGWVFSDPQSYHHFVPATYLRLASEELDLRQGHVGRLLQRTSDLRIIDVAPAAAGNVLVRRNDHRLRYASLQLDVAGAQSGELELTGGGRVFSAPLHLGRAVVVGLPGGRYRLRLALEDGRQLEGQVDVEGAAPTRLSLELPTPSVPTGSQSSPRSLLPAAPASESAGR